MKKLLISCSDIILLFAAGTVFAVEKAPKKVVDLANTSLTKFGGNPVIISAVKAENAKGRRQDHGSDQRNGQTVDRCPGSFR